MNYRKILNFIAVLLFVGCFAVTILHILISALSSLDKNLTKLKVVVVNEPVHHYSGVNNTSFYSFSCEEYKCDFRISHESLEVIQENKEARKRLRNVKFQDTLDIYIQSSEVKKLHRPRNVHIIGLLQSDQAIIDPAKVIETNKQKIKINSIMFSLCGIIAVVWLTRKYIKAKRQHTTEE